MLRVADVVIEERDIASLRDDEIDELNAFSNELAKESGPDDPPTPNDVARRAYRNVPDFVVAREFTARDGERNIVGRCGTSWAKTEENQHILDGWGRVHPDHRRRGIGTSFLRIVVAAADDAGKSTIILRTTDFVPAGVEFAKAIGAEQGLVGHTNRLVLAEVDCALMRRWVDEGPSRAPGYSLLWIEGPYPDDLIEEVVDLEAVMNTAPRDNLDIEDQRPTVEIVRAQEKSFFAQNGERWQLVARHDATGALVGWTEVGWLPHTPDTVWQWGTGVRPEHRGHALGKWLKAVMAERILEERRYAVDVRTHNADSNDPMLGINRAMGFKPYRTDIHWQIKVDQAKKYLESR